MLQPHITFVNQTTEIWRDIQFTTGLSAELNVSIDNHLSISTIAILVFHELPFHPYWQTILPVTELPTPPDIHVSYDSSRFTISTTIKCVIEAHQSFWCETHESCIGIPFPQRKDQAVGTDTISDVREWLVTIFRTIQVQRYPQPVSLHYDVREPPVLEILHVFFTGYHAVFNDLRKRHKDHRGLTTRAPVTDLVHVRRLRQYGVFRNDIADVQATQYRLWFQEIPEVLVFLYGIGDFHTADFTVTRTLKDQEFGRTVLNGITVVTRDPKTWNNPHYTDFTIGPMVPNIGTIFSFHTSHVLRASWITHHKHLT